ncbi:MAG: Fe-S cluster assembly protein SufB [Bacteroidetes bacterium QS_9_68_14]|nr:MAG: Fe-S cluster assembly protein SufB [Bacteroidetes bacterium QS_9_68_14]
MSTAETEYLQAKADQEYEHGWTTDIESDTVEPGLDEETVRLISAKKDEPEWLLEWRLKAYRYFDRLTDERDFYPDWAHLDYDEPDFQNMSYYSAPKEKAQYDSMDEVPQELLDTFERLGIPLEEQKALTGVAVDAVMDSVSVATTFQEKLEEAGVLFMSFGEAVQEHPDLVRENMGSVVPYTDNLYAALNSAVFSDGSFVYVPEGVTCPMELSTYFRINEQGTGQFERTLIVAEEGSYVSYMEGCTAPMRKENQLHAAVVEIIAEEDAEVKYSTIQNWYPGNPETGEGGVFNLVTKRGICKGDRAKISWTQLETGSAVTQKYPSVILKGDDSVGEFYSVAFTKGHQQADTGTKMTHIGENTKSTIISKGISAGVAENSYRGLVKINEGAENARNFSQCDSLLIGEECGAHTFPYIEVGNPSAKVEHEATTSKVGEDQMFYCHQRGLGEEEALKLIVNGFCKEILAELPMEFAVEAKELLAIELEGSVG